MKVSYPLLDEVGKRAVDRMLEVRKRNYLKAMNNPEWVPNAIIIVGDRPGPAAPTDPSYHHHTPFYSTKHCSGWLNAALYLEGIPEERLIWLNSADKDGNQTNFDILLKLEPDTVIALGENAEAWLRKSDVLSEWYKFNHPQYWKRFKNSQSYPLIEFLGWHFGLRTLNEGEYF